MISFKEVIKGTMISDIPIVHQQNIQELLKRVNVLREAWGKPLIVTSGYRTMQDHVRIYSQKGTVDLSKIPMRSQHLIGCAIDLYDPDLAFTKWLKEDNSKRLVEAGLYAEEGNSNWCHLQMYAPRSGRRWFLP